MKPAKNPPQRKKPKNRIPAEPLKDLRGSHRHTGQPKKQERFVNHGLEESPGEARARFHSELLDRVRMQSEDGLPVPPKKKEALLETIDVWEQSLWASVDKSPGSEENQR